MRLAAAAVLSSVLLVATACGGDSGTDSSSGAPTGATSGSSTSGAVTIDVTISGDTATPNGERVAVQHGQDVVLDVTADAPGEIHVHSTPEQEFEYEAGETKLTVANLDQPGIVTIESHTLDKVIVQLEVS